MTKKIFVFDWNGTLLNDIPANYAGFNETLKFYGQPEITLERYRDTMDFPLIHVHTRNGVHPDEYLKHYDEATDIFFACYKPIAKGCALKEGTVELLDYLQDQGYDLMVLSNQNDADLRDQIAERHVTHYFKIISGNQDNSLTFHAKTNKLDRLHDILADHTYDLSQSYIIGDSLEEPDLAHRMGLNCFSVTWGCFSRERLEKTTTNHVIDDLAEVTEILQKSSVKEAV